MATEKKGRPEGKKGISPADYIRMIALHCEGATQEQIAKTFDIHSRTVYKLFAQPDFERLKARILDRIADNCGDRLSGISAPSGKRQ